MRLGFTDFDGMWWDGMGLGGGEEGREGRERGCAVDGGGGVSWLRRRGGDRLEGMMWSASE